MKVVRFDEIVVGMRTPPGLEVTDIEIDEDTGRYEIVFDNGKESVGGSYDTTLTVDDA
jgi:hypothetical protein